MGIDEVKIKLIKSPIGYEGSQGATLRALGLRKMNSVVTKKCTPPIVGMIKKVIHLVEISE